MDDERAFAMMKRENSDAFGNNAPADAGVIAGLIAGYVDGRLTLKKVHPETPIHFIYLAERDKGELKIIGPGGREVQEARSSNRWTTFTAHTLAKHLGWTLARGDDLKPSPRFYTAFNVLTKLILPGAATPSELVGCELRDNSIIQELAELRDEL